MVLAAQALVHIALRKSAGRKPGTLRLDRQSLADTRTEPKGEMLTHVTIYHYVSRRDTQAQCQLVAIDLSTFASSTTCPSRASAATDWPGKNLLSSNAKANLSTNCF